jgi:hypothetical protein
MRDPVHTTESEVISPCIRAFRHTNTEYTFIPCTHTYLHSSAQRNSVYHTQTCPTTTHSFEQAMYCTYVSVWSVELWASAAAMCCAASAPMELHPRLHAHVCVRKMIQRTCVAHDARSRTARSYTPMHTCMPRYQIQIRVHTLHAYLPTFLPSFQCITQ